MLRLAEIRNRQVRRTIRPRAPTAPRLPTRLLRMPDVSSSVLLTETRRANGSLSLSARKEARRRRRPEDGGLRGDVAPLNPLSTGPYRVRIRCVKRSGGGKGNSSARVIRNVFLRAAHPPWGRDLSSHRPNRRPSAAPAMSKGFLRGLCNLPGTWFATHVTNSGQVLRRGRNNVT